MRVNIIVSYMPLDMEVSLIKSMKLLRVTKHTILIPFMLEKSLKMVEYRSPLCKKRFGILEPKSSNQFRKNAEVMIVPVIGFDIKLRRVGFGKGFFDRFFDSLDYKPFVIFVQRECCYTVNNITDSFDVGADLVVTPKKIFARNSSIYGRDFDNSSLRNSIHRLRIFCSQEGRCTKISNIFGTSKSQSKGN
jgi:5-formyltetrahydrofolate cyclo-ligase